MENPILVWMLFINREMNAEEYEAAYKQMQTCAPHASVRYAPDNVDTGRQIIAHLLPLLMMRHRRIPRAKWRDMTSPNGKHWIEQGIDNPEQALNPNRLRTMIGYHLAYDNNLVGMVMTQGRQRDVINLGIGMKHLAVSPPDTSVSVYAESFHHKLTPVERAFIEPSLGDEVVLRRLCLILALKQAYIKAIGQPMGFDWSRLEFNLPGEVAYGDGEPLQGWEFRVWQANIGIRSAEAPLEEAYQCAIAFFRGLTKTRFVWQKDRKELESWVQFINLDQLINVIPKLAD